MIKPKTIRLVSKNVSSENFTNTLNTRNNSMNYVNLINDNTGNENKNINSKINILDDLNRLSNQATLNKTDTNNIEMLKYAINNFNNSVPSYTNLLN